MFYNYVMELFHPKFVLLYLPFFGEQNISCANANNTISAIFALIYLI